MQYQLCQIENWWFIINCVTCALPKESLLIDLIEFFLCLRLKQYVILYTYNYFTLYLFWQKLLTIIQDHYSPQRLFPNLITHGKSSGKQQPSAFADYYKSYLSPQNMKYSFITNYVIRTLPADTSSDYHNKTWRFSRMTSHFHEWIIRSHIYH